MWFFPGNSAPGIVDSVIKEIASALKWNFQSSWKRDYKSEIELQRANCYDDYRVSKEAPGHQTQS